jgi:hypothetical protein
MLPSRRNSTVISTSPGSPTPTGIAGLSGQLKDFRRFVDVLAHILITRRQQNNAKERFMRTRPVRTAWAGLISLVTLAMILMLAAGTASADNVSATTAVSAGPTAGLPSDWVSRGSGQFETSDPQDLLEYRIELNAVRPEIVEFRLEADKRCIWWKRLVMPDGLGNSWNIDIDPTAGEFADSNALWSPQVHNGQRLELWKAGVLGFPYRVLYIGDLDPIPPGSRVVITWLRDSGTC